MNCSPLEIKVVCPLEITDKVRTCYMLAEHGVSLRSGLKHFLNRLFEKAVVLLVATIIL